MLGFSTLLYWLSESLFICDWLSELESDLVFSSCSCALFVIGNRCSSSTGSTPIRLAIIFLPGGEVFNITEDHRSEKGGETSAGGTQLREEVAVEKLSDQLLSDNQYAIFSSIQDLCTILLILVLLMTNALSYPLIISHTHPTNNKNLNISKYALMISLLIKRGLSKCCQLRMPRAAQRVVSNRARRLLADRKGQDPNLTSQGVSVHLRSRQDAFDPNVTVALAKAASGLDKTQDSQLR